MNDEQLLSEIRKEANEYIQGKTGFKLSGHPREDHYAFEFILLRIAKLEKKLGE